MSTWAKIWNVIFMSLADQGVTTRKSNQVSNILNSLYEFKLTSK